MRAIDELQSRAYRFVWSDVSASAPRWHRASVHAARLGLALGRDLASGALTLRAMSLVFTSLLSFVPLIAVSFSVLTAFGVHNRLEPLLHRLLAPLGERAHELTERILEFVGNIEVGVLGTLGIVLLLYTAISLVQKVEAAFNYTWNVDRHRTLVRRFTDYLSVLFIGPILLLAALGLTATLASSAAVEALASIQPFGLLLQALAVLMPYLVVIAVFTFLYLLIPNTRVRVTAALTGGVVGGVAWEAVGGIFALFIATSTKYTAIYSGFAIVLLFMLWLYLSWLILLLGSAIAFYKQNPEYLRIGGRDAHGLSIAQTERLGLALMGAIAADWYAEALPPSRDALARRLRLPVAMIDHAIAALSSAGLIAPTSEGATGYLPAVPPERTMVDRVVTALRDYGSLDRVFGDGDTPDRRAMARIEDALHRDLGTMTLAELAQAEHEATA